LKDDNTIRKSMLTVRANIWTRKPSWRWQTRATQTDAKIAPVRRVSFHFTEFHFPKFHITNA